MIGFSDYIWHFLGLWYTLLIHKNIIVLSCFVLSALRSLNRNVVVIIIFFEERLMVLPGGDFFVLPPGFSIFSLEVSCANVSPLHGGTQRLELCTLCFIFYSCNFCLNTIVVLISFQKHDLCTRLTLLEVAVVCDTCGPNSRHPT